MAELSYPPGTPTWVDVSSSDLARSRAFYLGLFDWDVAEVPDSGGYFEFRHRGRLVAGAYPAPEEGAASLWHTYFAVADADAAAAAAEAAGGALLRPPTALGEQGRFAVLADPAGASFSIWEAGEMAGAEAVNEPGAFCWIELQSGATDAVKPFYRSVFGWEGRTNDFGGIAYTEWLLEGESVAGMMAMPPDAPPDLPPFWLVYFSVEDCAEAVRRAEAVGAEVLVPPFSSPAGRFSVLQDPLGASFAVIAFAE